MYWQINECERSKTIVWTRVRIIESAPVSQYFSSSHRTECDSLDSLLKSLERNYILLSSPLLFFFFFFFFSWNHFSVPEIFSPSFVFNTACLRVCCFDRCSIEERMDQFERLSKRLSGRFVAERKELQRRILLSVSCARSEQETTGATAATAAAFHLCALRQGVYLDV